MGEAKRKQYSRAQFLLVHPRCAYCGDAATTSDHCPPRSFFDRREWPETFEFPACGTCNEQARLDEQALAVLVGFRPTDQGEQRQAEWRRLFDGLGRNQPEFVLEWRDVGSARRKRFYREAFGSHGDDLRRAGWGALNIGPLTRAAIRRFSVKLGQALYYRHSVEIFEGDISTIHIDPLVKNNDTEYLKNVLELAPELVQPSRNQKSVQDKFAYRFNHSPELGALYVVAQFAPQMVIQIIAVRKDLAQRLEADVLAQGVMIPEGVVTRCALKAA
jgi:hypothetical protein